MNRRWGTVLALWLAIPTLPAQLRQAIPQVTFTLVVHVREATGAPLPLAAEVKLTHQDIAGVARQFTGIGGVATFNNMPFGEFAIEVDAGGYETAHETVSVMNNFGSTHAYVSMRHQGDSSTDTTHRPPSGLPVLAGRTRKEVDLAIAALRDNKAGEAAKHLDYALKHAPNHPDVLYIAALCAIERKDNAQAQQYLESAVKLFPAHVGSQLALGGLLFQTNVDGAITHLDKALSLDPNQWRGHWMLAEAYLKANRELLKAKFHAGRAVELGKDKATGAIVTLALAEAMGGEHDAARQRLERFVAQNASDPAAPRARALLARFEEPAAPRETAVVFPVQPAGPNLNIPDVPALRLPPGVDEVMPPVVDAVSCSLPQVLEGAARRTRDFTDALQRFSATESIIHEEVDSAGIRRKSDPYSFDYTVALSWPRPGVMSIREMRNGRFAVNDFPLPLVTEGTPAIGLVFHPSYSPDFQFVCEGLGNWHGQLAWQVRFEQRADRPARIHNWAVGLGGKSYGIRLKGRAWIAATSYQVERIETEMMKPVAEIRLEYEHMMVEYAPVKSGQIQLWLPASAEVYTRYRDRLFRQQHDFTKFTLFSVDTKEKINDPKDQ